jgi:hypothetical protein
MALMEFLGTGHAARPADRVRHLVGSIESGMPALAGGAALAPTTLGTLRRARELLARYADLPMDYADATLVALAEELDTDLIFTPDVRDFRTYRIRARKRFRIVP